MSFFKDIFDNLLGTKNSRRDNSIEGNNHEHFRNPIWQNDQEEDDDFGDDYSINSTHFGPLSFGLFEVITNPANFTRFFKSELENINKEILSIESEIQTSKKNLRDEVLKPEFSNNFDSIGTKTDEDLDGKITPSDLTKVLKNSDNHEPKQFVSYMFTSSAYQSSMSSGGIYEKTKVIDSDGNTEEIIKKKISDNKIYTSIKKKDKNGVITETETIENMNDDEISKLKNFKAWEPVESDLSSSFWEKYFGKIPKL